MRRTMLMCTGVAAAGLLLTACGPKKAADTASTGESTPAVASASGKSVDPCTLFTPAEMEALTTDKVQSVQPQDKGTCKYVSNPNDGLELTVFASGGQQKMTVVHKTAELLGGMGASVKDKGGAGADVATMLKPDGTPAPALGDEQVWEANNTLAVRKGEVFVEVSPPIMHDPANHPGYPLIPKADARAIATAVAQKALAKVAP